MCGDFVAPVLVARLVKPISGIACFAMTCFTEDEYIRQRHLTFCAKPITLDSSVIIFCKRFLKIDASVDKLLWTGCITWLTDALCWSHHGVTMV